MLLRKLNFQGIKPEVLKIIQFHAKENMSNLYDPKFEEKDQCSGYHAFKALIFLQSKIHRDIEFYDQMKRTTSYDVPGTYLLDKIHVLLRQRALDCARDIRKQFKIYQDQ